MRSLRWHLSPSLHLFFILGSHDCIHHLQERVHINGARFCRPCMSRIQHFAATDGKYFVGPRKVATRWWPARRFRAWTCTRHPDHRIATFRHVRANISMGSFVILRLLTIGSFAITASALSVAPSAGLIEGRPNGRRSGTLGVLFALPDCANRQPKASLCGSEGPTHCQRGSLGQRPTSSGRHSAAAQN